MYTRGADMDLQQFLNPSIEGSNLHQTQGLKQQALRLDSLIFSCLSISLPAIQ